MKVGKMVRGFTVGEFDVKGKKCLGFSMEDDRYLKNRGS